MAQALIGDGLLAHTMTDRSAMRINDVTVLPRTSAGDERPRRPTSTVSTSRASAASSASGSPCLRIVSTASPASLTRSSGLGGPPRQYVVTATRFKALSHHDIFGAAAS